ncbi:MAG: hypothetical protein IIW01_05995, partial [Thermoguttaceae bacterium]|nr:hypothetical protein [Thermoguttaceae bacterium]
MSLETAPLLALTAGDPAGVGPEIIAGAWRSFFPTPDDSAASAFPLPASRPLVFGDPDVMRRAVAVAKTDARVVAVDSVSEAADGYPSRFGAST